MRSDTVFSMVLIGIGATMFVNPAFGLGILFCVANCKLADLLLRR